MPENSKQNAAKALDGAPFDYAEADESAEAAQAEEDDTTIEVPVLDSEPSDELVALNELALREISAAAESPACETASWVEDPPVVAHEALTHPEHPSPEELSGAPTHCEYDLYPPLYSVLC